MNIWVEARKSAVSGETIATGLTEQACPGAQLQPQSHLVWADEALLTVS